MRLPGLDLLRGLTALLVVLHHTALTYGAIGGWYYREVAPSEAFPGTLLVFFCTLNQAWFMGLFFLLAGYFTPGSLQRKGWLSFAADRALRLGLPLLVYGFLLGPVTLALAATARGKPFLDSVLSIASRGGFEHGPLWFAQALLLMTAAGMLAGALLGGPAAARPPQNLEVPTAPANCPGHRTLLAAALGAGAAAWVLRQFWPVGVSVWGMQPGYFASYLVLFGFGWHAARGAWLERVPAETVRVWWRVAALALPVLPAVYLAGAHWPLLRGPVLDVVYAFWEPLVAWGVLARLVSAFVQRVPAPQGWEPRLARRAYAIYVIHPPVLVGVSLAWAGVEAPPLIKFAVTGALACALCHAVAGMLLRVPRLARIL